LVKLGTQLSMYVLIKLSLNITWTYTYLTTQDICRNRLLQPMGPEKQIAAELKNNKY